MHVSPEAEEKGPLFAVRNGYIISLDVHERIITLEVDDEEMQKREGGKNTVREAPGRGYGNYIMSMFIRYTWAVILIFLGLETGR